MPKSARILFFTALSALAFSVQARQENEKLSECVDLPAGYEMARFGSQYLLVKDGDNSYRLGFSGSCDAIAMSSTVKISTKGQPDRLCPAATRVSTKRDMCGVREVVRIDEDEYDRYARKRR
jgi:hypothetical protein